MAQVPGKAGRSRQTGLAALQRGHCHRVSGDFPSGKSIATRAASLMYPFPLEQIFFFKELSVLGKQIFPRSLIFFRETLHELQDVGV